MPERYQRPLLDELISQLGGVRLAVLEAETRLRGDLDAVPPSERESARNLIHYLALRGLDLRPIQRRLVAFGLSSLGRCESQVLPSVDAVLAALHGLAQRTWSFDVPPAGLPVEPGTAGDLERRTVDLLGPPREGRPVRIMVTMPSEAACDPSFAETLIAAGMDVARINAAHDDEAAWVAISAHVRQAASRAGRPCKILFDLSGPKLRTGAFGAGAAVARVKPRRDLRGLVLEPGRVRLYLAQTGPADPTAIPVDGAGLFDDARPGDVIEVEEPSGRRRSLVVEAIAEAALVCACDRSVRFEAGRPLRRLREVEVVAAARVGPLAPKSDPVRLFPGDEVLLGDESVEASAPPRDAAGRRAAPVRIPSTLGPALAQIEPGDPIWFDDGRIGGTVFGREGGLLRVRVEVAAKEGTNLRPDKGINLPNTRLDFPRPTPQDVADLGFAVGHADMVGFSFVEQPEDVLRLEALLGERGGDHLGIVLKIETRRAFEALPQLLLTGLRSPPLGVMVARGDLAVEVGFARLAEVQEQILWLCEAAHVPVIWATQVLETLAKTGLPTRSEVSDAAMGVRAECVMLNKGPFVADAVRMLDDVLRRMQDHHIKKRSMLRRLRSFDPFRGG